MRRKRIAAFLAGLNREYQRDFAWGMVDEAKAQQIDLCLFTCQGATGSLAAQDDLSEASIFDLPELADFDAITALCATVATVSSRRHLHELLAAQSGKPQVIIDDTAPQAVCMSFNDENSVRDLTRHLVEDHGYRRFMILSGPKNNPIADKRWRICAETLATYGIIVNEQDVFDGMWVREGGQTAVRELLLRGDPLPDVFICGNDDMAFGVIDVLEEHGYRVPEDVCVTGFDARREAVGRGLTTIRRPVRDAGIETIRILSSWIDGNEPKERRVVLDTQVVYGDSCDCPNTASITRTRSFVRTLSEEHRTMERSMLQTSSFSNALAAVMSEPEAGDVLNNFAGRWMLNQFHVCVDPDFFHAPDDAPSDTKNRLLLSSYNQGVIRPQQVFPTRSLLPMLAAERDESVALVFCPLYYLERNFGYAVLGIEFATTLTLYPLLTMLGSGLMSLHLQSRVRSYAKALEDLSVRDSLTGLLNRRGYQKEAPILLEKALMHQQVFVMLSSDMDGMKLVNDRFGHLTGDKAICRMGAAMHALESLGLVCVHISGDEFIAFGTVPDENTAAQAAACLQRGIDQKNAEDPWVFSVQASIGVYYAVPCPGDTVEDYQNKADRIMYDNKRMRKTQSNT